MKPKSLIILSFSLLAGCASGMHITWERTSIENITQLCKSKTVVGCAVYSQDQRQCFVYTPLESELHLVTQLKTTDEIKQWIILGHETQHCFEGQFHK